MWRKQKDREPTSSTMTAERTGKPFSRRLLVRRATVLGLAAASLGPLYRIARMIPYTESNGQLTKDTIAFLDVPDVNTLRNECYHANQPLTLDGITREGQEEYKHVSLYIFGDSMNLANGIRYASQGLKQIQAWGYDVLKKAKSYFKKKNITDETWEQYNYAIPGSSTQGLTGIESPDGNAQLGNKDIQRQILNDPNTPIIAIGVNGNNWRASAKRALDLYNNVDGKSPNFKDFLDKLDLMGNDIPLMDKLRANGGELLNLLFNDHVLAEQIDGLFKLIQKDTADFQKGFQKALAIVTKLNKERKRKKKTEIKLAITLPIDMQLRDVIPYTPPNAPRDARGKFVYGSIPNASGAVYRITAAIYGSVNHQLRQHENDDGFPQFTTVPFLGFESDPYFFADDGHFAPLGEINVSDEFLKHVSHTAQTLNSLFNGTALPQRRLNP